MDREQISAAPLNLVLFSSAAQFGICQIPYTFFKINLCKRSQILSLKLGELPSDIIRVRGPVLLKTPLCMVVPPLKYDPP
jgi:hypothetical protein